MSLAGRARIRGFLILKNTGNDENIISVVKDTLYERCFENKKADNKIVIGLSGGPDSVCLTHVLSKLFPKEKLIAVHINHMLRGKESDSEQAYCEELCKSLEIRLEVFQVDIKELAKKRKLGLEECARNERYRIFEKVREINNFNYIAVAHIINDHAETIIMNVFRGTGIDGLKGIVYRNGMVIRPTLLLTREHTVSYCERNDLNPKIDSSNLSEDYTRNLIRNKLIPQINEMLGKDISKQVINLGEHAKNDSEFLEKLTNQAFKLICNKTEDGSVQIEREGLLDLDQALQLRLVRMAIAKVAQGLKDVSFTQVKSVLELAKKGVSGKVVALASGAEAYYAYDVLTIRKQVRSPETPEPKIPAVNLEIPSVTEFAGVIFEAEVFERKAGEPLEEGDNVIYIENSKINGNLVVRNRLNGDIIYPEHSTGSKKLKDYLIDLKVPRNERDKLVLIAYGNEIVWIVGVVKSKKYIATANDGGRECIRICKKS